MKQSSTAILREGKREIRAIGSSCDPACAMWAFCQNSVPDGSCKGFLLLNGKSQNLLNKTLNEDDKIYVQNVTRMAQGEYPEERREMLVREVLRFIPHQERESGFSYMVKCSLGIESAEDAQPETQTEIRATSGLSSMLDAISSKSEQPHTPILIRRFNENDFPDFCNPQQCPPDFARHCRANRPENYGRACIYKTAKNE